MTPEQQSKRIEKFLGRVEQDAVNGCWRWLGSKMGNGYGNAWWEGRSRPIHRIMHEFFIGSVPPGLDLDHLCRVRDCCNPTHVEPATRRENIHRSPYVNKTHCLLGHEFSGRNLIERPNRHGGITRFCRTCNLLAVQRYQARKREAIRL